jgi:hypothetical protein
MQPAHKEGFAVAYCMNYIAEWVAFPFCLVGIIAILERESYCMSL